MAINKALVINLLNGNSCDNCIYNGKKLYIWNLCLRTRLVKDDKEACDNWKAIQVYV